MKQISIFEILKNMDPQWEEIKDDDLLKFDGIVPIVDPVTNVRRDASRIDKTFPGTVNGIPAIIGCRTWLRTLWTKDQFIEEFQPIQWRPRK